MIQMVLYLHLGTFAGLVVRELDRQIGDIDRELRLSPNSSLDEPIDLSSAVVRLGAA